MRVLVTSAYPKEPEPITSFLAAAKSDRIRAHELTDDPDQADLILFVESSHYVDDPFLSALRNHAWVKRYPEKVFTYNGHDWPWCVLPGIYMSMPRRHFDRTRVRSGRYARMLNPHIEKAARDVPEPDLLFSFVGAPRLAVRRRILALRHPRAWLESTAGFNPFTLAGQKDETRLQSYARTMARSKFVICPRGAGVCSIRLFESLCAGRVPVIVADGWVPPDGVHWEDFAIFVRERDVDRIPSVLERAESRFAEMALRARTVWDEHFANDVLFHRSVELCSSIVASRRLPERLRRRLPTTSAIEHAGRWGTVVLRRTLKTWLQPLYSK
jgi:hypothetical protein